MSLRFAIVEKKDFYGITDAIIIHPVSNLILIDLLP